MRRIRRRSTKTSSIPDFACEDAGALWDALRDVVLFWVDQGVKIFRVDNPHTKPFPFWEWLIHEVQLHHPDVIFLAEAFTRPKLMKGLAKLGFTQSYTYFTWRTQSWELEQYLTELTGYPERDYYRPNFFVNTPDILPYHLQSGEPWMFKSRVALAATLSGTYGIYNGFELLEHEPIPGREEYLNSEKYEIKVRDWDKPGNIKPYIRDLNRARRANPALQQTSNLRFLAVEDGNVIGFVKESVDQTNTVAVAIALSRDVHEVWLPLGDVQVGADGDRRNVAAVENLITGERYPLEWGGIRVRIDPGTRSRRALPLPGVRGTAMNVLSSIDTKELTVTETADELWYKDAIIYQLHVKAFADSNNDGIGDFAGLTEKLPYLQDLGVTALWLLPFYPSPGRDDGYDIADYGDINPDFGTMKDFKRFIQEAKTTRSARHHRARHQSHFRPARLVQARAPQRSQIERAQLVCLERHRPEIPGHADHLHRHREVELDLGSRSRPVLLAPLLLASARPELRQSARGQRARAGDEALARHRRRRFPSRRDPLSVRARRHQQRKPARDPRHHQEAARRTRRLRQGQGAAGRSQSMAGGRAGIFRPRRRMPHGLSLPADAAHLHGDRAGRPLSDHRHPAADPGYSGQLPMGAVPAQP